MDVRRNAADLTDAERDRFLEALVRLDNTQAEGAPDGVTRYDQFVALHSVVMAVLPPGEDENPVNYAHWHIGFFPWHRQFVRDFEKALQEVGDESVTVPYWDWGDPEAVFSKVFTGDLLGSLRPAPRRELVDSVLRNPVPEAERPAWWPAGVSGYRIHPGVADLIPGEALLRGTTQEAFDVWRPTPELYAAIEQLVIEIEDVHPFWHVWKAIEEGATLRRTPTGWVNEPRRLPTHNAGHNFVGGHMSNPRVSPNDPVFWLHHANVDRLWANWQARRLQDAGAPPEKHYPPPDQDSPLGHPQPAGHRLPDMMWPWVGATPGYRLKIPADDPMRPLLPDFSDRPPVRVEDVLDTESIDTVGYRYAPPGG
jgi:tyrosinase